MKLKLQTKDRGDSFTTILLPSYTDALATKWTAHLTRIYDGKDTGNLIYSRVENNAFNVYGDPGAFSWIVYGKRGSIEAEPNKADVQLRGDGPYTLSALMCAMTEEAKAWRL